MIEKKRLPSSKTSRIEAFVFDMKCFSVLGFDR